MSIFNYSTAGKKIVQDVLPVIGSAIGGPFGGAAMSMISKAIFPDEPDKKLSTVDVAKLIQDGDYDTITFEPKREIIDYVVSNLSNKFDIKRLGSFAKAISKLAETSHTTYLDDLLSDDDKDVLNYITSLRTRIKGFVGNFFNEFMIAREKGHYLNTDSLPDTTGAEDKFVADRTSDSQIIVSKATGFAVYFASNRLDEALVLQCARSSDIPYSELMNVLYNTQRDKDPIMKHIASALITLYLEEYRDPELKGIASRRWIPFAMSQFIKTNTSNPAIIMIKDNFEKILTRYCNKFTATKREATKSSYRKALMLFASAYIQKYINRG